MPPRDMPHGADTLSTGCYLAKGLDDPGFREWAGQHPDWIVAGTWTAAEPGAGGDGPGQGGPMGATTTLDGYVLSGPGQQPDRAAPTVRPNVGMGKPPAPPLDPATISLADFRDVAAKAKGEAARPGPPPGTPFSAPILPAASDPSTSVDQDKMTGRHGELSPSPHRNHTAERLQDVPSNAGAEADRAVDAINHAMVAHGIDSPGQRTAFLARVTAETRQLQAVGESSDDTAKVFRTQLPSGTAAQPSPPTQSLPKNER